MRLLIFFLTFNLFTSSLIAPLYAQDKQPNTSINLETESNSQLNPQFPTEQFFRGTVTQIIEEGNRDIGGQQHPFQRVQILLSNGDTIETEYTGGYRLQSSQRVKVSDQVLVVLTTIANSPEYFLIDFYRLQSVAILVGIFLLILFLLARIKGLTSLLGLCFSVLVLARFIVPQIIAGSNPFIILLVGTFIIAFFSLYLAHGFNRRTTIALISTLITLAISILVSYFAVSLTHLTGLGSEESFQLQLGPLGNINFQGLLLGGIIIGALGVLDDITTSQTATVEEISKANPKLTFSQLYNHGISVGHEHIASLVNTLVLAYAGSSMPLFLIFATSSQQPLWITLNSEFFTEEIVRTIVGSITLVLAVPISTLIAAKAAKSKSSISHK